jgi:hypothetical protein
MNMLDPRMEPLRRALTELAEIAGGGQACPEAVALWSSAQADLPRGEDAAVIRHIGECTACGLAWELARELSPVREQPERVRSWTKGWRSLAAAAAVLLAATALFLLVPSDVESPSRPVYRDGATAWLSSELPEDQPLPRDGTVLRWTAGPDGTTYDVGVTSESLQPLARAWRLDKPEFRLDPDDLVAIEAGGRVLWRVTAHLPDGDTVVSMTFMHTVE